MLLNEESPGFRTNLDTIPMLFEECEHLTSPPKGGGTILPDG